MSVIEVAQLIADPRGCYRILRSRLDQHGMLAPFPEFAAVVQHIERHLSSKSVCDRVTDDLAPLHELALNKLFSVQLTFTVADDGYPHSPPFAEPFPYYPTIAAIQHALEFIDVIARLEHPTLPAMYHTDRYLYHSYHVLNSSFVYFPTIKSLSMTDLVRTRVAPIGFLGVITQPTFADGYLNSPLEFWMHDMNHVRRLATFDAVAREQHDDLSEFAIMPWIRCSNVVVQQLCLCILFEIVHEYAYVLTKSSVIAALSQKHGAPSAFEHIPAKDFTRDTLERYRLANGNVLSGFSHSDTPDVRYFFDRGPSVLLSVKNKLINGFYDNVHAGVVSADLPPLEQRSDANIIAAFHLLIQLCDANPDAFDANLQLREPYEKYPNATLRPLNS